MRANKSPVRASSLMRRAIVTAQEERQLREYRRKNLDYLLNAPGGIDPQTLAKKLKCESNYVSQLRGGHRPITFNKARDIEQAAGVTRLSLDSPPQPVPKEPLTHDDLRSTVIAVLKDECRLHNKVPRGALFDSMVESCVVDASLRGYNEGRVRHIAGVFLK